MKCATCGKETDSLSSLTSECEDCWDKKGQESTRPCAYCGHPIGPDPAEHVRQYHETYDREPWDDEKEDW